MAAVKCSFHKGDECMGNGVLYLQQGLHPGSPGYAETVEIWGPEAGQAPNEFRTELGAFCTLSAVMAWCDKQGAIKGAKPGDLRARRPGNRQHADQRPTVATRRPRASLAPRREP